MSAQPRWEHIEPAGRPVVVPGKVAPRSDRDAARVVSVIALTSIAAGAIHVAAAATLGRGSSQTLAFFGVVAAAEIVWGVVALAWAPRWWLALGALGNAVVVATWVVSRTVGLPVVPADAWPEVVPLAKWVLTRSGGAGCVREFCDGVWEAQRA